MCYLLSVSGLPTKFEVLLILFCSFIKKKRMRKQKREMWGRIEKKFFLFFLKKRRAKQNRIDSNRDLRAVGRRDDHWLSSV